MSVNLENLDAFLNYDLDVSARRSGKVLAILARKNAQGFREEYLKVIDFNTMSIWTSFKTKIALWWNDSLKKKTIGNFFSNNIQNWSAQVDQTHKVHFETQCAKLSRKIRFAHAPQWNLNIKIQYPNPDLPGNPIQELHSVTTFDRLTTNAQIHNIIAAVSVQMKAHGKSLVVPVTSLFNKNAYTGEYKGEVFGNLMQPDQNSGDRSCTLTLSDFNQARLNEYYTQAIRQEALDEGYRSGYRQGKSVGYHQGYNAGGYSAGAHLAVGLAAGVAMGQRRHYHRHRF